MEVPRPDDFIARPKHTLVVAELALDACEREPLDDVEAAVVRGRDRASADVGLAAP
jgi:hypothetical protein